MKNHQPTRVEPKRDLPERADPVFCRLLDDAGLSRDLRVGRWGRLSDIDVAQLQQVERESWRLLSSYLIARGRAGVE